MIKYACWKRIIFRIFSRYFFECYFFLHPVWAAHPTPPPGVITRDSPHSQHQAHLRMCYDPSDSPQTAISSNPSQFLERPCFHWSKRAKLCQDSTVSWECSKMNIIAEKKVKTSSVKHLDGGANLDLPGPSMRELKQRVEQVRMHHSGAEIPKWSKMNVNTKFHHTHLQTKVRLWLQTLDFPFGKSNKWDMHRKDACRVGEFLGPRLRLRARELTWDNDRVNIVT